MNQLAANQTPVGQLWRFRVFERAMRDQRDGAWNALAGGDPAGDMQAAFDDYTGSLQTYVDAMNAGFANAFSGMDTALNAAFASFQSILSGATTVAEVPGSYWSAMDDEVEAAQAGGAAAIGEAAQWAAAQEAGAAPPGVASRSSAQRITVKFGGVSDPNWYAQEVEWINGPRWGRALIWVPLSQGVSREAAGSVALVASGPAAAIRIGTPVEIAGGAWHGRVVNVKHQIGTPNGDGLMVTAYDLRHDLSEVRVVGRWVWDAENEEAVYQQGWPAIFNPGGRPNCIFSANGLPLFAPYPDYGLEDGQEPPAAGDKSPYYATYWTLALIMEYARNTVGPDGGFTAQFPWVPRCPASIVWPVGLGASLDATAQANFNQGSDQGNSQLGGARKGRELNAEGMGLLELLETLLFTAGGYTLGLDFGKSSGGDARGTLRIRPDRYLRDGVTLYWKRNESGGTQAAIDAGFFEESGEDLVTGMACAAGLVTIERLCSEASTELVPAWTDARFDAWRTAIIDLGNDETAFDEACRLYPEVLTTWKLASNFNFMDGTGFSSHPRAKIPRPPFPRQLSLMTGGTGANDFAGMSWPIWVEFETETNVWAQTDEFDGLELFDNGIIHIPVPRRLATSVRCWKFTGAAALPGQADQDADGKADIEALRIRMNLAIPADHRLTYAVKLASDLLDQASAASETETIPSVDAQRIDPSFQKQGYVDLGDLYQLWLRKNSYVAPKTLADVAEAAETSTETAAQTAEDAAETARAAYLADPTEGNLAASTAAATAATTARATADAAASEADRLHPPDRPGIVTGFEDALRNDYALLQNFTRRKLLDLGRLVKAGELHISGHLVASYQPGLQVSTFAPLDGGARFPAYCVLNGYRWISSGGPNPDTRTVLIVGGLATSPLPG